jgi:L-ascorbate metabolism protein UlaG (beta-lactamase superfamily)|tara:strand:- start:140 stop:769 length:630 start_codon:yes stop_codon:yes gene_type:complete
MEITWLGQASFSFNSRDVVLITDPQHTMLGRLSSNKQPDIVTYSHTVSADQSSSSTHAVAGPGEYEISHFYLSGMGTILKRDSMPEESLVNTIYTIRVEGLTLCHLGYLTQKLTPAQIDQLGQPQILLGPVSGDGILSTSDLQETISAIQPRIFLPVQYSADESSNGQSPLGKFLSEMGATDLEPQRRLNLTETNLPGELRVVTMELTS